MNSRFNSASLGAELKSKFLFGIPPLAAGEISLFSWFRIFFIWF